ncbi:MAG: AtpZ/AtpI family protein [Terracoccus sp.]
MTSTPPGETPENEPMGPAEPVEPVEPVDEVEKLRDFNVREQDSAWRAVAYLLSGPLIYGGVGYLADLWLGTTWLVGVGIVGGMALSLYLIWFRYGTQ